MQIVYIVQDKKKVLAVFDEAVKADEFVERKAQRAKIITRILNAPLMI